MSAELTDLRSSTIRGSFTDLRLRDSIYILTILLKRSSCSWTQRMKSRRYRPDTRISTGGADLKSRRRKSKIVIRRCDRANAKYVLYDMRAPARGMTLLKA